jgi:hypothetical protein
MQKAPTVIAVLPELRARWIAFAEWIVTFLGVDIVSDISPLIYLWTPAKLV